MLEIFKEEIRRLTHIGVSWVCEKIEKSAEDNQQIFSE